MEDDEGELVVDLLGHCAFCRRELTEEKGIVTCESAFENEDTVRIVPKAVGESELTSFNHVWGHLLGSREGRMSSVKYTFLNSSGGGEGLIPPMCQYCGETINQLDKLHKELMLKVEEIKRIVEESSQNGIYSWRDEELQRKLGSALLLKPRVKERTCQFLGNLLKSSSEDLAPAFFDDGLVSNLDGLTDLNCNKPRRPVSSTQSAAKQQEKSRRSAKTGVKSPLNELSREEPASESIVKQEVYSPPPTPAAYYSGESDENASNNADTQLTPRRRGSGSDFEIEEEESSEEGEEANSSGSEYSPKKVKSGRKRMTRARRGKGKGRKRTGLASNHLTPKKEEKEDVLDINFSSEFINEDDDEKRSEDGSRTESPNYNQAKSLEEESEDAKESDSTSVHQDSSSDDDTSGPSSTSFRNKKARLEIKRSRNASSTPTITKRDRKFVCETCDKRFSTQTAMNRHQRSFHSDRITTTKKLGCDICKKSFWCKTENALMFHKIKVHGADPSPLKCAVCGRQYSSFPNLSEHEKTHSTVKDFKCDRDNCDKSYPSKFRLSKHITSVHEGEREICKTCAKTFSTKDALDNHIKSVHLRVKHECSVCKAQLSTAYSLQGHMRIHTGEMPFSCSKCAKKFKTKSELNQHVRICGVVKPPSSVFKVPRRRNSNIRAKGFKFNCFKCSFPECGTQFASKKELLAHKKAIHGDCWKKFVCETCGKGFSTDKSLQGHTDAVHLGLSIICELCGDVFGSHYSLDSHMRIHTGERPYECHICRQKFRQQANLANHLKAHQEQGDKFQPRGSWEQKRRR